MGTQQEMKQQLIMGMLLLMTWGIAALIPYLVTVPIAISDMWVWVVVLGIPAYFIWTGVRAWRRGWKSRFILRLVVPVVILVASSLVQVFLLWGAK
jgi:hypothetical protein